MQPDHTLIAATRRRLPHLPEEERYTVAQAIELYEGFCDLAEHDHESLQFAIASYIFRVTLPPTELQKD